jgi:ABC-2 type transport system permease protein
MKSVRDIMLLFRRSFVETKANLVWVGVGISTPLLYLVLFAPLLQKLAGGPGFPGGNVLNTFLPGILAFLAFASGNGPGFTVSYELQEGVIERFRVTPTSRFGLLFSPILNNVVWFLLFMVIFVVAALPFGFQFHLAGLLVSFVLMALLLIIVSAFSISIALITKDLSSLAAVMNGINLPVLLLSGVLLPMTLAPLWMRVIAHVNPVYYVVERHGGAGVPRHRAAHGAGALVGDRRLPQGRRLRRPCCTLAPALSR